jgi:hypothetical protein
MVLNVVTMLNLTEVIHIPDAAWPPLVLFPFAANAINALSLWLAYDRQSIKADTRLPEVSSRPIPPVEQPKPDGPPPDWPVDKLWTGERRSI